MSGALAHLVFRSSTCTYGVESSTACVVQRAALSAWTAAGQPRQAAAEEIDDHAAMGQPEYAVRITLKGFEQRYLQEASTTIRDLLLVHMAPQRQLVTDPRTGKQAGPHSSRQCASSRAHRGAAL